jgi:hypothetical protein
MPWGRALNRQLVQNRLTRSFTLCVCMRGTARASHGKSVSGSRLLSTGIVHRIVIHAIQLVCDVISCVGRMSRQSACVRMISPNHVGILSKSGNFLRSQQCRWIGDLWLDLRDMTAPVVPDEHVPTLKAHYERLEQS